MPERITSEDLAIEWQYQMLAILRDSLAKHGITGDKAHGIASDFCFDFSMLHDQGYVEVDGREYSPVIVFSEGEEAPDFELHDYAFGNTDIAFGRS